MKGLSVKIKTETQFNILKDFLGELLYVEWVPQMGIVETGVIIWCDDVNFFSLGSVGATDYQSLQGIRVVEFSDYFKNK